MAFSSNGGVLSPPPSPLRYTSMVVCIFFELCGLFFERGGADKQPIPSERELEDSTFSRTYLL